jgi:hypothetical protein
MELLSDEEWDRLRIAWQVLHPGSYPERGAMLSDAIEALEREAADRRAARVIQVPDGTLR